VIQEDNIIDTKNRTKSLNAEGLSLSGVHSGPARGGRLKSLLRGRFGGMYTFMALFVSACFLLRTGLLIHSFSDIDHSVPALIKIYAVGLFFDVITSFLAVIPVAVYLTLMPDKVLRWKPSRYLALAGYFAAVFLVLFDTVADWLFWEEFGSQFNFLVVDYLLYTREMIGNAMESYPVKTIMGIILLVTIIVVFLTRKPFLMIKGPSTFGQRLKTGLMHLLIPCLFLIFVSRSWADISQNQYNNELAKNNLLGLVTAFFNNSIDYEKFYLTEKDTRVLAHVKDLLKTDYSRYINDDKDDITRTITSPGAEIKKNVIVLVVESLSARYLGIFGDKAHLTPNLDALAGESLLFRNLYATGTRTTRGLEAIAMSVPPTPGRSLIKRPKNRNLFTIGQVLKKKGYETKFMYGGFGYFDNMNGFFSGNGFEIVDRSSLSQDENTFATIWGVCDENLFDRVLKEGDKSFSHNKPFLSIVMTTSNHRPYAYPQKIDIPSGSGRSGAVKYTDYAIGRFIRQAREKPWFKDTVFAIVADHCAGSSGRVEVPVHRYHIPLIIYSPGFVKAGECASLCSQIDVGPTLLGLLSISYESRFFGVNVLRSPPGRAFLGTYQKLGLLTDGKLTLLKPGKKADGYRVGPDDSQSKATLEKGLLFDTVTYYQAASYLLKHHLLSSR
jgi:phosphoglycerol transferase MdoB-like AlkP superfamily enzyme